MGFFGSNKNEKPDKYINVKMASELLGVSTQAVYKALSPKQQTMPGERVEGRTKTEIRIAVSDFLIFLKDEKNTVEEKLKQLEKAEALMRRL